MDMRRYLTERTSSQGAGEELDVEERTPGKR